MAVNAKALARATALIAWADDKLEVEELKNIQQIFQKYGVDWQEVKPLVEECMEDLITGDEEDDEESSDLQIGVLDFGEVDFREVLNDLAELAMVDKVADYKELDILHAIGRACNMDPAIVSCALLQAARKYNPKLAFASQEA